MIGRTRAVSARAFTRATAAGHYQGVGKGLGRRRLLIAAVIAALVVVPAALVIAQQRAASAATILSILDGSASVARGTTAFVAAADGDIVNTGDRVQTADRSHALVTFFDGSTLEIEPATTVQIEEASSAASGAISIRIAQTIGRTWSSVQKLTHADSKFELRTPALTAAVRGTGFITEVLGDGTSSVQTTDGAVQVTAQGQSVLVTAGQITTTSPNTPPTAPAPTPARPNTLRFGMHSPAYVVVVDPFGRACGIVLPGPTVVRQIPGCLASEPGTDPQLVDVPNASPGFYRIVIATTAPGGAFIATASAIDGSGALSFNYTASGSGEPGTKFGSSIDVSAAAGGALTANGLSALTLIETSPVKVVLRSPSPKPTISGTPDTS
ncbi:MAG: FecR family protein, partial [Candidatus Limnocylindria bacterium]